MLAIWPVNCCTQRHSIVFATSLVETSKSATVKKRGGGYSLERRTLKGLSHSRSAILLLFAPAMDGSDWKNSQRFLYRFWLVSLDGAIRSGSGQL